MVTKHRKLYSIVITLVCLAVLSSGITVSADGKPEDPKGGKPVQGPDIPPAGVRYDEWKKFKYSSDTSFPVRTYWSFCMNDGSSLPKQGFIQDPEHIEDAVLTITDAKAEPVGAEMKLRSAGYVDITIEL